MARIRGSFIVLSLLGILAWAALGVAQQQTVTQTIREPAQVRIEELFKQADLVAVVRILSGDTEHYSPTVYKAEVVQSFKGAEKGGTIFFGPFISFGLGNEYFLFLRHSGKGIEPKGGAPVAGMSYGPIPDFYLVMYEGYSALPIDYACVFDGQDIAQQCDYGIKINTSQVVLPRSLKTFPSVDKGASSDVTKWVRKTAFLSLMQRLAR